MIRCKTCCMPDTRPDTEFVDGECTACISYRKRDTVDWGAREKELFQLLDRHQGRCIVPSSGGKDSTWQVLKLLSMGADVTVVTATTCHLTDMGRKNIDNLARYARTIECTPNRTVRAKLNRLGLELVGDISWPEHVSIFTTPFQIACALNIPLIFYGENPQEAYGGPKGADEARTMTRRWVSEFGGFLGLRPADMVGQDGITARDMEDYAPPSDRLINEAQVEAHFIGQYVRWDSHRNAKESIAAGFSYQSPSGANWWPWENQDNAQTGIHDYMMFRKFGYGRGCAQISVDVRAGLITREKALEWVSKRDGLYPSTYMGIPIEDILARIGVDRAKFMEIVKRFAA